MPIYFVKRHNWTHASRQRFSTCIFSLLYKYSNYKHIFCVYTHKHKSCKKFDFLFKWFQVCRCCFTKGLRLHNNRDTIFSKLAGLLLIFTVLSWILCHYVIPCELGIHNTIWTFRTLKTMIIKWCFTFCLLGFLLCSFFFIFFLNPWYFYKTFIFLYSFVDVFSQKRVQNLSKNYKNLKIQILLWMIPKMDSFKT